MAWVILLNQIWNFFPVYSIEEDQNLALVVQSLNAERQYSTLNYFHFEIKDEGPCVTQVCE